MLLSSDKISAIRERADIVKVIGARIVLKKKGQRYLGLCPFHGENTPSFSVSSEKGLYYCFGCHAGGDVFSFLMRHQGLSFQEAARVLAKDSGVELEPESDEEKKQRKQREELAHTNEFLQAFFEHALWQSGGARARVYLTERGLPAEFARERRLGFGGAAGEALSYLHAKKVPVELLNRAGIMTEDNRRMLFEGRVVFPVFDSMGNLAGFSARRLGENGPKYINSRETELFRKRHLLYGWEVAEEAIRKSGRIVLVEGQMDVLACERDGVGEAVASLGTAFGDNHAQMVSRLAKEAVVMFDGDAAGRAASREAAQKLIAAKMKTLVAPLTAGSDPDSLLRDKGSGVLLAVVKDAKPALEHFIEVSFAGEHSIEERAQAARDLAPLLHALPSGLERDLYTSRLADKVGVTVERLQEHLRPKPPVVKPKSPEPTAVASAESPIAKAQSKRLDQFEQNILRDVFLFPQLRGRCGDLAEFAGDVMRALLDDMANSDEAIHEILERHITDGRVLANLTAIVPDTTGEPEELAARESRTFDDVLSRLKGRHMQAVRREMMRELAEAEARGEDTDDLLRRIQNLTRRERELKRPGTG